MDKACYKLKLVRIQRLINIKIAKAYRTVSNDALCILTGLTPIDIKIQEAAEYYQLTEGNKKDEALVDGDTEVKHWHPPAETITFPAENNEASAIQMFTDGSKSEQGVGAGVAIFQAGTHIASLQVKRKMYQQSSCAAGNIESSRIYRKLANRPQDSHHIYRQPSYNGLT